MIDFSVHGSSHSFFKTARATDHVAELCMLMHGDIDDFLWRKKSPRDGIVVRRILDALSERIRTKKNFAAAELLYAIATYASFEVLDLHLRSPALFNKIVPRRTLLPCLISIHPNTAKVIAIMRDNARLGTETWESRFIRSRPWFTSDAAANVYARAIITGVELNQDLEPIEQQQKSWEPFDRKNHVKTHVLPFPRYINGIDKIPVPISPESVLQYWRKGKEMILEEMPNFHFHPEWKAYHRRSYKDGAKRGAIQHAIFKDILVALRTIAGANKTANKRSLQRC